MTRFFGHALPPLWAVLAAVILRSPAMPQETPPGPGSPSGVPGSAAVMYELAPIATGDSSTARVDILYRIDAAYFVSVRSQDTQGGFQRRGEILIELRDATGIPRFRDLRALERRDPDEVKPEPGRSWIQGAFSFDVDPATYSVLFEVVDLESRRRIVDNSRRVTAHPFRQTGGTAAGAAIVDLASKDRFPSRFTLHNMGGDVLFGARTGLLLEIPSADFPGDSVEVILTYAMVRRSTEDTVRVMTDTVSGIRIHRGDLGRPASDSAGVHYALAPRPDGPIAVLLAPLKTETLPLRRYTIHAEVRQESVRREARRAFRTVWPDMPRSMRDVEYAIESLRFIAPERVIDSLASGSLEERWANLEAFWKSRDQTSGTAVNEVMNEYYRRIDHAAVAYATLRQPDGTRTDRGRTYVLYGPPSRTDRSLDPARGFRETWTYERLNRTFVFVDRNRNGDYILSPQQP